MSWPARSLLVWLCCWSAACERPARALGATPELAQRHADQAFLALARCFGPLEMQPAVADLRPRLARYAFVPSRLFDDPAWARPGPAQRVAVFHGRQDGPRYRLGVGAVAPQPREVGDYRGTLRLVRLGTDEHEWSQHDELALGALGVADAARALEALLGLVESAADAGAADGLRASLPRTSAALGKAFRLDRVRLFSVPGGGRTLHAQATLVPDALGTGAQRLAAFLRRVVLPMRFRLSVGDSQGQFWELSVFEGRILLVLRVQAGRLAPLAGPPRALLWPLLARSSFSTRAGLFRVGFSGLESEVALVSSGREAGFRARFRRQPDFDLPLVQPFVKASLRRPFEGEGALLGFALQADEGGPSLAVREYRVVVRESGLMRWLSDFAGGAVMDFRSGAEAEFDRYSGEVLSALHDDIVALARRPSSS